jgi:hypothetical protein
MMDLQFTMKLSIPAWSSGSSYFNVETRYPENFCGYVQPSRQNVVQHLNSGINILFSSPSCRRRHRHHHHQQQLHKKISVQDKI